MVQTAGFDPSLIPAGPSEGRRTSENEPDSSRVTPINEAEGQRADRRRSDPTDRPLVEPPTRVAFTAKFGPDSDGFPLQIVRGDDVTAAENFDVETITARRVSREDREVLLRAQEEESRALEAERQQRAADDAENAARAEESRGSDETAVQTGSTLDVQV